MENKPRKIWVAGLLSLISPGLGQVYNGELKKALLIYVLPVLLLPGMILCLYSNYHIKVFLFSCVVISILFYFYVLIDAIKTAKKFSSEYQLKKYNKTIAYIGVYILVIILSHVISAVIKGNIIHAYKIPARSMEPTLLVGDHILVDRTPSARNPQKGDVIVFEYPKDSTKDFIKRVVAIGGETIEIKDKQLIVNGNFVNEEYVVHRDAVTYPATLQPRDNSGPVVVPANSFFVMGDNRDESMDSRFWGFVAKTKVKGTAKTIYWSWDKEEKVVRSNRIGLKVQ